MIVKDLLSNASLQLAREAMCPKADTMVAELLECGRVDDLNRESPFEARLAELSTGKSDEEFPDYGRS